MIRLRSLWGLLAAMLIACLYAAPTFAEIGINSSGYTGSTAPPGIVNHDLQMAPTTFAIDIDNPAVSAAMTTTIKWYDSAGLARHDVTRGSTASAHAIIGAGCSEATLIPKTDTVTADTGDPHNFLVAGVKKLTNAYRNPSGATSRTMIAAIDRNPSGIEPAGTQVTAAFIDSTRASNSPHFANDYGAG